MSQASIEKAICTNCNTFAAGTAAVGGFLCEECHKIFIIQHQLWKLPVYERNKIIFEEGLKE